MPVQRCGLPLHLARGAHDLRRRRYGAEPAGPFARSSSDTHISALTCRCHALASGLGAPVVLAVALSDNPAEPTVVVGFGCHLTPAASPLRRGAASNRLPGHNRRYAA